MTKNNSNISLSSLLTALWKEQYFSDPRDLSDIAKTIATKGFHPSISSVNVALIRLVRSGKVLSRTKTNGKWQYIQKAPTDPIIGSQKQFLAKYDLHPHVKRVALKQLHDGNFKEAIQNALVEVVDQVKIKTGYPKNANGRELDGDDLMNRIFGCDNQDPIIKFNSLQTSLDKAEQLGIMNLFKGIVGIRDRKAHLNFIQNDSSKTIEYLCLASLLLRLLDENPMTGIN